MRIFRVNAMSDEYDLIVIGTGPAGEKAAVKAAYFGYRVAIVEKNKVFGGAGVVTGTLPSKTLKETALYFSGKYEKDVFSVNRKLQHSASLEDFMYRKNIVTHSINHEIRENLTRHKVDIFIGVAQFKDSHSILIKEENGTNHTLTGKNIIIATGSYPFHPTEIPFDGVRIHDSDTILDITWMPKSLCIVGAGVIGCEYATIFANIGTEVHLIHNKDAILPQIDQELANDLIVQMQEEGIRVLFDSTIESVHVPMHRDEPVQISLHSGKRIECDMFLFAAGRSGTTGELQCEKLGLQMGKRQTLIVDHQYKTNIPHIYAVGDVIGFPSLASTSMEQGRVAVAHIFQTQDLHNLPTHFPYGIYTIPEISMVGLTEEEMILSKKPYCTGKARYGDLARGRIIGAKNGFLKLVINKDDLSICGVHIIGHMATEIIHFGLELVESKQTLYDIIGKVFNYPTLHDLYKYAAYDGLSNFKGYKIKE